MKVRFTFLGTSASLGVPVVGCECPVCKSRSSKDKRLRSSALLEVDGRKYLIDAGPDFRAQALSHEINELDGVIITHTHFDHIAGLDDLRVYSYNMKKPLPLLSSKDTLEDLQTRFPYLFKKDVKGLHRFSLQTLPKDEGELEFEGLRLKYFSYFQVGMKVTGIRLGNFAFATDIKDYSDELFDQLKGVDTLILSALDWGPTRAHIGVEEALEIAKRICAKKVYITHLGHELEHKKTNEALPDFFQLAYDGLCIDFTI